MAKRSNKKMTANQRAYAKEVRRIENAVRRAEKRGYRFYESVVPQTPKRITKQAIQRLKEITPNHIYDKAQYLDDNTGKVVSGLEGRKLERKEAGRKSAETRERNKKKGTTKTPKKGDYYPDGGKIIYTNVVESFIAKLSEPTEEYLITSWGKKARKQESAIQESERSKSTLLNITHKVIGEIGMSGLGWRLENEADRVTQLTDYILYGSDGAKIASACSELASIINGGVLSMQQLQDIAEQEEANEDWELPT